jgi:protein gp37
MAEKTKIEWCDHTFNPWVGCTKVSPACDHCYAEGWAKRSGMVQWGGERKRTSAANWQTPIKWNAQAEREGRRFRVFCASLADVFDNQVPDAWRMDLFKLIADTPHLDWLLLTKRIGNVERYLQVDGLAFDLMTSRVWLGATICNQAEAERDVPKLLDVPACVRFLSMEPLLGPVDLTRLPLPAGRYDALIGSMPSNAHINALRGFNDNGNRTRVDWVVVGGESGQHARPMHPEWAASLRDQCKEAGVPFLFKQWGEWHPSTHLQTIEGPGGTVMTGLWLKLDGTTHTPQDHVQWDASDAAMLRVGKSAAGRVLDGRIHNEFPEAT